MHITINNSISEINFVHKCFTYFASSKLEDESVIHKLCIVIDEVLTNIISHGYNDKDEHSIDIQCQIDNESILLTFQDDGVEFNPVMAQSAAIAGDSMDKIGGLGIHLMKNLVDDIQYERKDDFNRLKITKHVS